METILTTESIGRYRLWLLGKGLSANTTKGYSTDVEMFFQELGLTSCPVADLASQAAVWMRRTIDERTHKPKTIRRRMSAIRSFAEMCGQPNLLSGFKLPTPSKGVPHPLPGLLDDLVSMVNHCKTTDQRCLVAMLGFEGFRLHEALDARLDWFDLREMTITVYGKGSKERIVPITTRAHEHLLHQYIEASMAGRQTLLTYSDRGARNFITNLGVACGIRRPIASHDLRATFATLAYASTNDPAAVQALLGHESYDTTKIYVQVAMEAMRKAAEF